MSSYHTFAAGSMMTLFVMGLAIEARDCSRQAPIDNESRFEHHAVLCSAYCREINSTVLEIEWTAGTATPTCHCGPEWVDPE